MTTKVSIDESFAYGKYLGQLETLEQLSKIIEENKSLDLLKIYLQARLDTLRSVEQILRSQKQRQDSDVYGSGRQGSGESP